MAICNYCGNELPDGEFQCSRCGTVLFQLNCSKCGAVLDLKCPQCTDCGAGYSLPYGNPYLSQDNRFPASFSQEQHKTSGTDIRETAVGISRSARKQFQEKSKAFKRNLFDASQTFTSQYQPKLQEAGKRIGTSVQNASHNAYNHFESMRNNRSAEDGSSTNATAGLLQKKVGRLPLWAVMAAAVLLIVIGISVLGGSGSKYPQQQALIKKFETGINNGDINKLIDCFDPNYSQYLKSMLTMYNGGGSDAMNKLLSSMLGSNISFKDAKLRLNCDITDCVINGDSGTIYVHSQLYVNGQKMADDDTQMGIVKVNNGWYFNLF